MLLLSEDLLFIWEPVNLLMSWHVPHFPEWLAGGVRKSLVKNLVVGKF